MKKILGAYLFCIFSISGIAEDVPSPVAVVELSGLGDDSAFTITVEFMSASHIIAYDNADLERTCEGPLTYVPAEGKFMTNFSSEECEQNNFIAHITRDEFLKLCSNETASVKLGPKDADANWQANDVTAKLISGSCQ